MRQKELAFSKLCLLVFFDYQEVQGFREGLNKTHPTNKFAMLFLCVTLLQYIVISNLKGLKRAVLLIDSQAYSITEVSAMVGFSDISYFSTCFKKQFGKKPSEYVKEKRGGK